MRILVSNPDAMGDLILRQPLFAALQTAGHELLLLVRSEWAPLVPLVAPGAQILEIPVDPYYPESFQDRQQLEPFFDQVRALAPELIVIAPWNWTLFEEYLAVALAPTPMVGFRGVLYNHVTPSSIQFAQQLDVDVAVHEGEKNRLLASAILGATPPWGAPRLQALSAQIEQARAALQGLSWNNVPFWIASVGSDPINRAKQLRNWPEDRWVQVLRHAVERQGLRVLLIGTPDEQVINRRICETVGAPAHVQVLPDPVSSLDALIGSSALADGYLGRDTGPLHLAAALGKPVLAIYGGGTWPRFTPQARRVRVLTMEVPCHGCGWRCHLPHAYCVSEVPVGAVTAALDELCAELPDSVYCQQIPRATELVGRMELETVAAVQSLQEQLEQQLQQSARCQQISRADELVERMELETVAAVQSLQVQLEQQQQQQQQQLEFMRTEFQERTRVLEDRLRIREHHVNDLLASRWRKVGRTLRLVKPASCEQAEAADDTKRAG